MALNGRNLAAELRKEECMEQENTSESITTCSTQVIAIGNGASNIVDDALRQQPNDNNDFHFDNVLRRQLYDNIDSRFDEAPKQQPYNVDFLFVNDEQENTDEEIPHRNATILICCLGGETEAKHLNHDFLEKIRLSSDKVIGFFTYPQKFEGETQEKRAKEMADIALPYCDIAVIQYNDLIPSVCVSEMNKALTVLLRRLLCPWDRSGDSPTVENLPIRELAIQLLSVSTMADIQEFKNAKCLNIKVRKDGVLTELTGVLYGFWKNMTYCYAMLHIPNELRALLPPLE
jgi:hypothetical protein